MSGVGANTTQLAKWLGADDGKTVTTRNVKNVDLAKLINQGISDYGGIRQAGQDAFDKYFAQWQAGAPAATTRTNQEVGVVDRFYNPTGVENDLAMLRRNREAATNRAAELASMRAIRGLNSGRLLGAGTPSSYDMRQRMRYLGDIGVQSALDRTGQERSDYENLLNQRLGLAGRRQAMIDANTGRVLAPEMIRRNLYGQNLGFLGNLGEQDRANTFYGLKYDPSFAEELGTAFDNSISTMKDIYGMWGGGAPSGGAPTGNQMSALNTGMGPMSSGAANDYFDQLMGRGGMGSTSYGMWGR